MGPGPSPAVLLALTRLPGAGEGAGPGAAAGAGTSRAPGPRRTAIPRGAPGVGTVEDSVLTSCSGRRGEGARRGLAPRVTHRPPRGARLPDPACEDGKGRGRSCPVEVRPPPGAYSGGGSWESALGSVQVAGFGFRVRRRAPEAPVRATVCAAAYTALLAGANVGHAFTFARRRGSRSAPPVRPVLAGSLDGRRPPCKRFGSGGHSPA